MSVSRQMAIGLTHQAVSGESETELIPVRHDVSSLAEGRKLRYEKPVLVRVGTLESLTQWASANWLDGWFDVIPRVEELTSQPGSVKK